MSQPTDKDLLERFCQNRDRAALDALVRRHIDFVYASARRQVRDAHLAEDVTQAVFIVFARKAHAVAWQSLLPWLYTVTRHAASNARRMLHRRQYHEARKAAMYEPEAPADPQLDAQLRDSLDDAISQLSGMDRDSVVLHYLNNLPHKQVGAILGLSEEAARKRVTRAVGKLRDILARRGVAASAASLAVATQVHASAPAALIESTINVSLLSATSAPAAGTSAAIAKGVFNMFTLAKIKIAAAVALGVTTIAVAVPIVSAVRTVNPIAQTTVALNTAAVANADDKKYEIDVTDNIKVEFMGVAPFPGDAATWRDLAGNPIEQPALPGNPPQFMSPQPPEHQVVVHVTKPPSALARIQIEGASVNGVAQQKQMDGTDVEHMFITNGFTLQDGGKEANLTVNIATEAWTTVGKLENAQGGGAIENEKLGRFTLSAITEEEGRATVEASTEVQHAATAHDIMNEPIRFVAIDAEGKEYESRHMKVSHDGMSMSTTCGFDIKPDQVKSIAMQTRKFSKRVEVKGISLEAGHMTEPKIEVKDVK